MGPDWEGDTRVLPRVIRTRFGPSVLPLRLMREGASWDAAKAVGVAAILSPPALMLGCDLIQAKWRLVTFFHPPHLKNNP